MNANDLAKKLKKSCLPTWSKCTWEEHSESNFLKQCAIEMLLEQSQEIEKLKNDVEHYADRWRSACGDLEIEKDFKQLNFIKKVNEK